MIITKKEDISSLFFLFPNTPQNRKTDKKKLLSTLPPFSSFILTCSIFCSCQVCSRCISNLTWRQTESLFCVTATKREHLLWTSRPDKGFCLRLTLTRAPSVWRLDPRFCSCLLLSASDDPPPPPATPHPVSFVCQVGVEGKTRIRNIYDGSKRREMLAFQILLREWNQRCEVALDHPEQQLQHKN